MLNNQQSKNELLYSISGIKFLSLLFIFLMHSSVAFGNFNISSRCVEFFFVTSGFLAYYSKKDININCDFLSSMNYLKRKLIPIIPLYLIGYIYYLIISRPSFWIAFINFFMLQAWSNDSNVFFSLNGPSWFISALLFSHLLFPFFNKLIKNITNKYILVIISIRLIYELMVINSTVLPMNIHVSPLIRLFDFIIGMFAAKIFISLHMPQKTNIISFSLLEIILLCTFTTVDFYYGQILPKTFFVCFSAIITITFALNFGILSKLFSIKLFQILSSYQLEFYLLHAPIGSFVYVILGTLFPLIRVNLYLRISLASILIVVSSLIYKKLLKNPFEKIILDIFNKISLPI